MGKVLAFRKPEESCANCWFFTSQTSAYIGHADPQPGYCRQPDRIKDSSPIHPLIERLGLHCDPGRWCPKYVHADSPAMKKLQFVSGIKFVLLCLQQRLKSNTAGIEKTDEYGELVDKFYLENKKLVTINQYKAMKRDMGYFVHIIEETIKFYKQKSRERM